MLTIFRRTAAVLLALALSACATRAPIPGDAWLPQVAAIAAGEDTAARRAAITARLDALGIPWQLDPIVRKDGVTTGYNVIADLGGTGATLMIGAHLDRVDEGRGATDNASGSAAVLELAAALKARPLANHRVLLAFWDLEELGLIGSKDWVARHAGTTELYVNFDVFGWGDTLWIMAPDGATSFISAVQGAARAGGVPASIGTQYPPTDHLAFLQAGQAAVSFSLIDAAEISGILAAYAGQPPAQPPKVMQVIHSPRDDLDQLDPAAVRRALPAVLEALRRWALDHPELADPAHGR